MKHRILAFVCSIAAAFTAFAQVPSLINYQGRLTDSNGAPVTGNKNFAISIYDAATGGNLLYEETIGAVTLDANGVYSFQFGSAGSSNTQVTETIGTTAGSTLTYTKTLTNTPVVNNSITVTDGTNSWSQSVGNPGVGATATANTISGFVIGATITNGGSGYTSAPSVSITGAGTGATASATLTDGVVTGITINSAGSGYTGTVTITIAPPVIPFRVDYSSGTITATYASAPTAGRAISATYRYGTGGIAGALNAGAEHWMAVSVDGVVQATRQRVLAVPFAQKSHSAVIATNAPIAEALADKAQSLAESAAVAAELAKVNISTNFTSQTYSEFFTDSDGYYNKVAFSNLYGTNYPIGSQVINHPSGSNSYTLNNPLRYIQFKTTSTSGSQYGPNATITGTIFYSDGTNQPFNQSQGYGFWSNGQSVTHFIKPNKPGINVSSIQLSLTSTVAISCEVSIWINSFVHIDSILPTGYISSDYEYKAIASFSSVEEGATYNFSLVDDSNNVTNLDNDWFSVPLDKINATKIRLQIRAPISSVSELLNTRPMGIVLLRRQKL
jgi:hypothetical protein